MGGGGILQEEVDAAAGDADEDEHQLILPGELQGPGPQGPQGQVGKAHPQGYDLGGGVGRQHDLGQHKAAAPDQNGKQGIEMPQGFLLHGDVLLFLFLFSLRGQSAFRRAYSPPKRTGRSEISLVKKGHRPFLTSSCKMPGSTGHSAWGFAWGSVVNPGAGQGSRRSEPAGSGSWRY